jgi:N4-gp56 family major capsid protein
MATDAYTSTGSTSLGGTVGSAGLVQKAYDRLVEFALRSQPLLRSVADKRPSPGTLPGSSIALQLYNDLSAATSSLSETVDPDAVALATPNQVVVTLNEYGNAVVTTRKLQLFSLADVDPAVANIVAYNMADSIDKLVMTELRGGTNVRFSRDGSDTPTSTATVEETDTMKAADIRFAVAKLRGQNAVPRKGSLYWVGIHPEVAHDLRAETGAASWRNPHEYQSNQEIWAGEIGQFEGAYFVESNRLYAFGDGANVGSAGAPSGIVISGGVATVTESTHGYKTGDFIAISGATPAGLNATWEITVTGANTYTFVTSVTGTVTGTLAAQKKTKVYRTIVAGQQALAEAVAEEPHVVIGPVTDKLMRLRPIGWYGVLGFKRYREDALFRIESGSSIA